MQIIRACNENPIVVPHVERLFPDIDHLMMKGSYARLLPMLSDSELEAVLHLIESGEIAEE